MSKHTQCLYWIFNVPFIFMVSLCLLQFFILFNFMFLLKNYFFSNFCCCCCCCFSSFYYTTKKLCSQFTLPFSSCLNKTSPETYDLCFGLEIEFLFVRYIDLFYVHLKNTSSICTLRKTCVHFFSLHTEAGAKWLTCNCNLSNYKVPTEIHFRQN